MTPSIWNISGDHTASDLLVGTDYYLRISSVDNAGNISLPVTFNYKYREACVVGFDDLAMLCEQWLDTGESLNADINHDNTVDFGDFAILSSYWLSACPDDWPL